MPAESLLNLTNRANRGRGDRLAQKPPVYFERNLRYMLALTGEMGALPLLIGDPIPVGHSPEGLYQRVVPGHNAVMARLAWRGGDAALQAMRKGLAQVQGDTEILVWPAYFAIPLGAGLMTLVLFWQIVTALSGREARP